VRENVIYEGVNVSLHRLSTGCFGMVRYGVEEMELFKIRMEIAMM